MTKTRPSRPTGLFALSLITLAVTGCAVTPPGAFTTQELAHQAQADRQNMFAAQEAVSAPITLEEAIARAVKYNLKQRVALMERALEDELVEVQKQGMLPRLTARAGLRGRSNDQGSYSESLISGRQSLEPSASQERNNATADLQITWNVLDFGLSYFGAKAQSNKALAFEERRRRVVADIIRETRTAYWSAVTAERLKGELGDTLAQARQTLEYARQVEQRRLLAPITALRYQRDLLNMVRQTEHLDNELAQAKAKLAALMNLAPGTAFALAPPADATLTPPKLAYGLGDLEALAMVRRPELREEAYLARNAVLETRMSLLRLFPNASLFAGLNSDSNKYLSNHSWADAGVQVSWNLLNVLSLPAVERAGEAREQMAELRRQALRMTVLSQVHVAWLERERAEAVFQRAQELSTLQSAIQTQTENAARSSAETQLELVRARVEALLATRARDLSYAELVNAQNTIYQAAGIDPLPEQIADASVAGLAQSIAETNRAIEHGHVKIPQIESVRASAPTPTTIEAKTPTTMEAKTPVATLLPALRTVAGRPWDNLGSLASNGEAVPATTTP